MRNFFDDLLMPAVFGVLLFSGIFGGLMAAATVLEAYQCGKYEAVTGRPTKFTGLSCYVKDKGEWYSWSEYKHRLATKGEFSK